LKKNSKGVRYLYLSLFNLTLKNKNEILFSLIIFLNYKIYLLIHKLSYKLRGKEFLKYKYIYDYTIEQNTFIFIF